MLPRMIWEPISHSSRGSSAFTLPCVPTDIKTGVSTTPCGVVNRPRRARELASVFSNLNIENITIINGSEQNINDGLRACAGKVSA